MLESQRMPGSMICATVLRLRSLYADDDIKTIQANLGHATAQFTLDVYTQKMKQDSANRMQQFYDQLTKQ